MSEDRLFSKLNEELRQAHATKGELREQVIQLQKKLTQEQGAAVHISEVEEARAETERQRIAAENRAELAERKFREKANDLARAKDKNEKLRELKDALSDQLAAFDALNDRIKSAKHIGDLFGV
jgi:hypothetical protein